jgi:hypothetical protein
MSSPTVIDILARWPDREAVHADASLGDPALQPIAVYRWERRRSIPPRHWTALVAGAKRRRFKVTMEELAQAHTYQRGHALATAQAPDRKAGAA